MNGFIFQLICLLAIVVLGAWALGIWIWPEDGE
jgi:hypothetical protein